MCSARNTDTGEKCAIKKIANAFENVTDARRTLREIKLLRHLSHENIISVKDIMPPPSRTDFKDVYLVYELMDTDLHQIIRSSQPLTDDHSQYFVYQVSAARLFTRRRPPPRHAPCSAACLLEQLPWYSPPLGTVVPRRAPCNGLCRLQLPWYSPPLDTVVSHHAPCSEWPFLEQTPRTVRV